MERRNRSDSSFCGPDGGAVAGHEVAQVRPGQRVGLQRETLVGEQAVDPQVPRPLRLAGLLLEHLRKAPLARIINVSSCAHESPGRFRLEDLPKPSGNGGYGAYKRSKLCNILFTYELARRLEGENVTANALHPGLVRTNIARNNGLLGRVVNFFIGVRGITPDKGAETPVYLAASPEVEGVTGRYFVDCRPAPSASISYDAELAARLWDMSASLTAVDDPPAR